MDMEAFYFDTTNADNNNHTDDNTELQGGEIQKNALSTTNLHTFWCYT